MAYDRTDPRATLQPALNNTAVAGLIAEEQLLLIPQEPASQQTPLFRNWFQRGANFVLAYGEAIPGADIQRISQADEYVLLLPDEDSRATIEWAGESVALEGRQIVFIPAGNSRITLPQGGRFVRLFTALNTDLLELCVNKNAYHTPRTHIPQFHPWPDPPGGWHIRHYSLDVASEPGRFGRIFRCTTFMLNIFEPMKGPRDPSKMSPHHHDDFEQCSLVLSGEFVHHLRWPWTTDMADWKPDQHVLAGTPSSLIIPPPVIHTSQATGHGDNELVDIFCPPRMDFSQKENWVLNAADYPMP